MTMPVSFTRFHHSNGNIITELRSFLQRRNTETYDDISTTVRDIISDVRQRGDDALCDYTKRFDQLEITSDTIKLSVSDIAALSSQCPDNVTQALSFAAKRIREYHTRQRPESWHYDDEYNNRLGMRWQAVEAAGIYVPGGKASYPSSVLMNAIPAQVAGVSRITMVVPTPNGDINPALIVAAQLSGVDEIFRIGGAQAVAALAYGTQNVKAVNVIAGPGNAYVAEAKKQVFGTVGIDMVAGPSEILVIADGSVPAAWVAADLLSQAEHDELAQSILITTNADYADHVINEIEAQLAHLPRRDIAHKSLNAFGAIIIAKDKAQSCELADIIAGEHVELAVDAPQDWANDIHHAGALFLGRYTPEAIGDYVAGPSHVLPTTGSAAFSSGLSVHHFMKKTSLIACSDTGFAALAEAAATLADCEGLKAHADSVRIRLQH